MVWRVLQIGAGELQQRHQMTQSERGRELVDVVGGHLEVLYQDVFDARRAWMSSTPTRTTEPNRRIRIDSSMELMRSSASSSWISMSAFRVTRKAYDSRHRHSREQHAEILPDQVFQPDKPGVEASVAPPGISTSRGRTSGTFTRAKRSSPFGVAAQRSRD